MEEIRMARKTQRTVPRVVWTLAAKNYADFLILLTKKQKFTP